MRYIELEQGSPEWHDFRAHHLGSSDTPVVMEESPYMTRYQLFMQKMGLYQQEKTANMQMGNDKEAQARKRYCDLVQADFKPAVAESTDIPYLSASFDGINEEKQHVLEIKHCNATDFNFLTFGEIPKKWYGQIQKQLYVSGYDTASLYACHGENNAVSWISRDEKYISKMLEEESVFWHKVLSYDPPELCEKDYTTRSDHAWNVEKYLELENAKHQLKVWQNTVEELEEWYISQSNGRNSIGGEVSTLKIVRQGNVDYKAIPELQQINLEKYRKKPTEYWRVNIKKREE